MFRVMGTQYDGFRNTMLLALVIMLIVSVNSRITRLEMSIRDLEARLDYLRSLTTK